MDQVGRATTAAAYGYVFPSGTSPGMPLIDIEALRTVAVLSDNPNVRYANLDEYVDNAILQDITAGH